MKIEIPIEPVPLARHQINTLNKGRYLPQKSVDFRDEFRWELLRAVSAKELLKVPIAVTLHFYKSQKITSQNYGDIDNHVKAVLDACNKFLWTDDRLVTELHAYKHFGAGKIKMEVIESVATE